MKIGLIRCRLSEEKCGGGPCFKCINNCEGSLSEIESELELIGISTCGGCPGNQIKKRAMLFEEAGAEKIIFGSCIKLGTPVEFSCPHYDKLKKAIEKNTTDIEIIDWTHYTTYKDIFLNRIKNISLSDWQGLFNKGLKL